MAKKTEGSKFFNSPWATVARIFFTAIFFFWLYWIGNSTADLSDKLNSSNERFTAIDSIQVDYKDEIQEWKNLLLRSDSRETLNQNWLAYDNQYQKVTAAAQNIIAQNDVRSIKLKMQSFVETHAANHEKYKNSVFILIKNKYFPGPADAAVKGIDRPALDLLEAANVDLRDEKERVNESMVASARNKIEQSLFALAFIGLLAIWMPKH
jgi:methyl-accepting chemotaxis protein